MRFILPFVLLSISFLGFAQNADEELAAQYFLNEEYDKAEILYKKLHKKKPASVYIYQNYLDCLLKQNNVSEAEKMVAKQVKKFPGKPLFVVDLGHIYNLRGNEKKSEELYTEAIDETISRLKKERSFDGFPAEQLASAFLKRDEFEYAKTCLLEGRKAMGQPTIFAQNLIDLYKQTKDYEELIDECLLVLKYNNNELAAMKANLISLVDKDVKIDYLQERASIYLQKFPEKVVFDELLMWVFVQQKKFNSAYRQAVAMDKRNKTEGKNLIDLAEICLSNKSYAIAIKCYDKIADFGTDGYFFLVSKMGSLETNYRMVVEEGNYTEEDLNSLIGRFEEMLQTYGKNPNTAPSIKQLADIYVFHKHDLNTGVSLLEELIKMPRIQGHQRGQYKLALGDAYVMKDEVWDATLLYGQVDKEFKEEPLGQEAKFRNARLSYYRGDFDWAKDQLDVLKTATSQLISNNAIELSLLIKDNSGLDSSTDALEAFAKAQLLMFQNRLDESITALNLLPIQYPNHSLEDEIYLTKAQIFEKQGKFEKAEEYYTNVVKFFGEDILADNALYALGLMYENKLNQPEKAIEMYESIIFDHNGSLFVVDARKRYNELKKKYPGTVEAP
ncbi:MAG: tetratricopeptide repeat protein [Bacteroidia bacterium]|nr:tetratricopeptide repeat protein [Bacteroidia bacterium]